MAWKEEIRKDRMGNIVYEKYSLRVGKLYLTVVRGHINWPDKWVGNCPPLFNYVNLNASSAEEAKLKAFAAFCRDFYHMREEFEKLEAQLRPV